MWGTPWNFIILWWRHSNDLLFFRIVENKFSLWFCCVFVLNVENLRYFGQLLFSSMSWVSFWYDKELWNLVQLVRQTRNRNPRRIRWFHTSFSRCNFTAQCLNFDTIWACSSHQCKLSCSTLNKIHFICSIWIGILSILCVFYFMFLIFCVRYLFGHCEFCMVSLSFQFTLNCHFSDSQYLYFFFFSHFKTISMTQ